MASFELAEIEELRNHKLDSGIFSKTFIKNENVNIVFMKMAAGEDLTEHSSRFAATIHFLEGEGKITLGDEVQTIKGESVLYISPNLEHSLIAQKEWSFLLILHKKTKEEQ